MKILIIGDICGRAGRQTAGHFIPLLKRRYPIDIVIANGENAAGGTGITAPIYSELLSMGIDVITSGNHIWDKKEIFSFIDSADRLIRPANYPPGTPGRGYYLLKVNDITFAIINLAGRTFMPPVDCPFRTIDTILERLRDQADLFILDFHAEATSEKMALAWHLDGKISCLAGTHTHIQTADERLLLNGTAYITDIGMVGPWNSILGVDKDLVIQKFITGLPVKFSLAHGPNIFNALLIDIDEYSKRATSILRINEQINA